MSRISSIFSTSRSYSPNPSLVAARLEYDALMAKSSKETDSKYRAYPQFMPAGTAKDVAEELGDDGYDGMASFATLTSSNANLDLITYAYKTGRHMHAFVDTDFNDKILKLNIATNVSGHDGSASAEKWAKSNQYVVEVQYPDGKSEQIKFDTRGVKNSSKAYSTPQYGTVSPTFEIDIQKYAGQEIVIQSWPVGSAGPGGYIEGRKTVLHL